MSIGVEDVLKRFWRRAALFCALLGAAVIPVWAAPLDVPACEQLQLKLDTLRRDGVEADMALGPAAAKSTLSAERLDRIGAYIETEEQLNFRCGLAKQRIVLPTTIEGGEEEIQSPSEAPVEGASGTLPLPQRPPRAVKDAAVKGAGTAKKKGEPPAAKAPAKRRPAVAKAKEGETPAPAVTSPQPKPAAKPAAKSDKAAKKKPAAKADDAYRPPPKPVVREEKVAPTAKQ